MSLAGAVCGEHRVVVIARSFPGRAPFSVVASVDRDGGEPLAGEFLHKRKLTFFVTASAVQHHHRGSAPGTRLAQKDARNTLAALRGEGEVNLVETVRRGHLLHFGGERHTRPV